MSVRSRELDQTPASLPVATPDEFFPAVSRWSRIGGGFLFVAFAALVLLASVLRFNVTVRAGAAIRPAGELRLVQTRIEGTVAKILVTQDQVIEEGGVLAYVDDAHLRRERSRLEAARENAELHTGQIQAQLTALDRQIEAQNNLLARRQSGAEAQLQLREREHVQLLATTTADAEEARAEVEFARDELARYRTLAEQGTVSQIDIRARETRLSSLAAKLKRIEAALDPSAAAIRIATENIDEELARGEAVFASLLREREQLRQRMTENVTTLENLAADLSQLEADISSAIIRAPASGVIQELTLRNPGQLVRAGDLIARIAPPNSTLQIKALVAIRDIGRIDIGQRVHVRVSACPYTDYGTLEGTVTAISPDVITAQDVGRIYGAAAVAGAAGYEVTARPDGLVLADGVHLCDIQAGMEGRADIVSGQETVLKFLLRKARLSADT